MTAPKSQDRYSTEGLAEAQWEPRSHGRVLRNLLGITSKRTMDGVEAEAQVAALRSFIDEFSPAHRFTADDVRTMHERWLGKVYPWAGKWRQVNLSKGDLPFAAAAFLPALMQDFEAGPLKDFTPCPIGSMEETAHALALVHVELVLIHPFRDGNGRLARMLATLMGLQAGLPPLDFEPIVGRKRAGYFAAVRSGLDRNYGPMEKNFSEIIGKTLKRYGG
jgi:cell filamentation protein